VRANILAKMGLKKAGKGISRRWKGKKEKESRLSSTTGGRCKQTDMNLT